MVKLYHILDGWVRWISFKLQPCWLFGHRWVNISRGRVGLCHRCQGFYRLGKRKKVLERLDEKGRVLDRKERHAVRKMMETKQERWNRKWWERRVAAAMQRKAEAA